MGARAIEAGGGAERENEGMIDRFFAGAGMDSMNAGASSSSNEG